VKLTDVACLLGRAVVLRLLLLKFQGGNRSELALYGALLIILETFGIFLQHYYSSAVLRCQTKICTHLASEVYCKAFRQSNQSRKETSGKLITLGTSDVSQFALTLFLFVDMAASILRILLPLAGLVYLIQYAALIPVGLMLVCFVGQALTMGQVQRSIADYKSKGDSLIKKLREFLHGIKTIKFSAMEELTLGQVGEIRDKQTKVLARLFTFGGAIYFWTLIAIVMMSVVTFTGYWLMGGDLTPDRVFPAFLLIQILLQPLNEIPGQATNYARGKTAAERLELFFESSERSRVAFGKSTLETSDIALEIKNGSWKWGLEKKDAANSTVTTPFTLSSINLSIPKGKRVAVIGSVGSGKSSLLSALVGEMEENGDSVCLK
jgi:ABC-type transport system involved in cytochrome bd biosynthesis fused ATPase/permease subunit